MTVRTYVCMYVYKYVYVTGFTKPSTFAQKLNPFYCTGLKIATLKNYPCTVSLLSNVNWSAVLKDILLTL